MKKIIFSLLLLFILCGCTSREDFFILKFGNYSLAPGYDKVGKLNEVFTEHDELPSVLSANQTIQGIKYYRYGKLMVTIDIINTKTKDTNIEDCIISKCTYYLKDTGYDTIKINDLLLDNSIKTNCDNLNGKYINRNGYFATVSKTVGKYGNGIIMYGDIYAIDQDKLDHIDVFVERISDD